MSGIEVAGIVLGAFPVAIWALEQYRDVARVMGFWYEIRLEYQRSSNELKFHRLSFLRNLKQLLLPLMPDDAQLQRLISNPGGDAWKEPKIQNALEARLQDSYSLYLEILGEMQRVMQDLNHELAMDSEAVQSKVDEEKRCRPDGAASRFRKSFDRSSRGYQVFRAKFSIGERTRTRLFAEFQTYNDRLEKLMASSDVVSQLEESRQKQHLSSNLTTTNTAMSKFWGNAEKLYRAFLGAWGCRCRDHHCAHLTLQHRSLTDQDFHLHLDSGTNHAGLGKAWKLYSVRVKTLDQTTPKPGSLRQLDNRDSEKQVSIAMSTQQHDKTPAPKAAVSMAGKAKKRVRITESSGITVTQTKTKSQTLTILMKETASSPPPLKSVIQPPTDSQCSFKAPEALPIITDLCRTLDNEYPPKSTNQAPTPLGCLTLNDSDVRFEIHPDLSKVSNHNHISLSQLFLGEAKPPLTRRQRYRLSLVLASSFVQLKDTSWLQTPWDKYGVYFPAATTGKPVLDAPFIVSRFCPEPLSEPGNEASLKVTTLSNGHDVAGIACLGIMLLELCFGRAIEKHPSRLVLPNGAVEGEQMRAALDLIAALEWLKDVNDEAGADYTDAVEWCLAGCRTKAGDGSWRKLMVERVVDPLERCYKYLG
ncbi:hypothetical protein B0H63DRAFT_489708 [Podospora didyma]|uniref:DUF7580 domain-containing protein n=1 Tax=Podospora didyma TaxID=330526 RepID=A0AAE0K1B1_9PEZI|nr:hypothetical protein B0H63DRAFT_489708 [Podospora didyma]